MLSNWAVKQDRRLIEQKLHCLIEPSYTEAEAGSSMAQTVTQPQPEMSVHEAETATLNCVYDTSDSDYYLFWYKQPPSGEMILIIRQEAYKQQNATNNRFSVNFQKADKSFSLRISDSQLEDAAMYFCAFMR
uniref:Ig-like domain-containing protein n=1 Tax=Equus caballus TaxID=9796 RepID=A0A9L0R997_HORSE